MRHMIRDPYWLTTRRRGACARCERPVPSGARAFYFPNGRRLFCSSDTCGRAESRAFDAARFDEWSAGGA